VAQNVDCGGRAEFELTLEKSFVAARPKRLIGIRAYDSDRLDAQLETQGVVMIAQHKNNGVRQTTQDGRALRRYRHRWKVERLFAWLYHFCGLVTRYEYHVENFLGFVHLGCICVILRTLF
jgi:transposase